MYGTVGGAAASGRTRPRETKNWLKVEERSPALGAGRRTHDPGPANGSKPGSALLLQSSPPSDHKFAWSQHTDTVMMCYLPLNTRKNCDTREPGPAHVRQEAVWLESWEEMGFLSLSLPTNSSANTHFLACCLIITAFYIWGFSTIHK